MTSANPRPWNPTRATFQVLSRRRNPDAWFRCLRERGSAPRAWRPHEPHARGRQGSAVPVTRRCRRREIPGRTAPHSKDPADTSLDETWPWPPYRHPRGHTRQRRLAPQTQPEWVGRAQVGLGTGTPGPCVSPTASPPHPAGGWGHHRPGRRRGGLPGPDTSTAGLAWGALALAGARSPRLASGRVTASEG